MKTTSNEARSRAIYSQNLEVMRPPVIYTV